MARTGRRDFIRSGALASAGLAATRPGWARALAAGGPAADDAPSGHVVHAHHGRAATWPRTAGRYRDYVDYAAVSMLLDRAVCRLKGGSPDEAWARVFPKDAPETRRLSIKISCNNATDPVDGAGTQVDAIPEPAMAVIAGFLRAGGAEGNVNVYDATNTAPSRVIASWFRDRVRAVFPGVLFNAPWGGGGSGCDARTCVTWDPAWTSPPPPTRIAGAILSADYIVNVPIVKRHGSANGSLGYKNHFGSIQNCDQLHSYVFSDTPEGSVLADIMGSPLVPSDPSVVPLWRKTVLTVGDMLYGQPCTNFGHEPRPWQTWRNEWPNCLVVSDDACAADSVMLDLLECEPASDGGCGSIRAWARRYLQVAEAKGQGVFDHVALPSGRPFDPARMAYAKIRYEWLDEWPSGAVLSASRYSTGAVLLTWQHYFPGPCEVLRATRRDFADAVVLGSSTQGKYVDVKPPEPAFYRVRFAG